MAAPLKSTVKLEIYLTHSTDYANRFLSSSYTPDVTKALDFPNLKTKPPPSPNPRYVPPAWRYPHLDLPNRLPSSTALGTIAVALETNYGIPLEVQSHYRDFGPWFYQFGGHVPLGPSVTLADAWALQEDTARLPWGKVSSYAMDPDPEEKTPDIVRIVLVTTAGFLAEMEERREERGLLALVTRWRYFGNCVKYLDSKVKRRDDAANKAPYEKKLCEHEAEWKKLGDMILQRVGEWQKLVLGSGDIKIESAGLANLEQVVEAAFQRWEQWRREKDGEEETSIAEGVQDTTTPKPTLEQKYLRFDHLDPSKSNSIVTKPLRNSQGLLDLSLSDFSVRSGILLWGQLHTVFAGSIAKGFTGSIAPMQEDRPEATIIQRKYTYRSAARNGKWNIRKVFNNLDPKVNGGRGRPTNHTGWIMFHEDVNALDTVHRCTRLNPESGFHESHVDEDILYVNRYDWSEQCEPTSEEAWTKFIKSIDAKIVPGESLEHHDIEVLKELYNLKSGYMIAVDAANFDANFARSLLRECPTSGERVFLHNDTGSGRETAKRAEREAFGTWLSMPDTEYEYGWLIFSDRKHPEFIDQYELVAILYDGGGYLTDASDFAVENNPSTPNTEW